MKCIFALFLLFFFFTSKKCQIIDILELEKLKKKSLVSKSFNYFNLTIPENTKANYLFIQLKANKELDFKDNIVSDPNLYISQTNKYPNKKENQWSSTRFGDEIVSIDAKYFNVTKFFYISVYCESKCNYILSAKLYENYSFKEKNIYTVSLNGEESIKISFTSREKFKKLKINCFGKGKQSFQMFIAPENPSILNTIDCKYSFTNGIICLLNDTNPYYKANQNFEILLINIVEKQDFIIWLQYDDEESNIEELSPIIDTADTKEANCYKFEIDKKKRDKDIILSVNLFNGKGYIKLGGWKEVENKEIPNSKTKEDVYPIFSDKSILLNKDNYKKYGDYEVYTKLHFCFIAAEDSSYSIKIYYFENAETAQKLNYLLPGILSQDILPNSKVTSYSLLHYKQNRDMQIDLTIKSGEPKLYIHYSYKNYSYFNNSTLVELEKNYDLVTAKKINGKKQRVEILENYNKCTQLPIKDGQGCEIYAIIECTGNLICVYELFYDHFAEEITMKNRVIYSNVITRHEEDKYKILITDNRTKNIAIVLNQNTGTSKIVMKDYSGDVFLKLSDKKYSELFLSNFIELRAEDLGLINLKGIIYFQIVGETFASYSLYYYSFDDENSNVLDHKNVIMEVSKGQIIREAIKENHYVKVYGYDNSKPTDKNKELFMFLDINDYTGKIYIFKDLDDYSIENDEIKGYLWESDDYGYINLKRIDPIYRSLDYFYIIIAKSFKKYEDDSFYKKPSSSYFSFGLTDDLTTFVLNEGEEFKQRLTKGHPKQKYQYNHINIANNKYQLSVASNGGKMKLSIKINNKDYIKDKIIIENIYLEVEEKEIEKYCHISESCYVEIEIEALNFYELDFDIIILSRSNINKPILLANTLSNKRSLLHNENQYFIIELNMESNIDVKINALFKGGIGLIYVKKISIKEQNIEINQFPSKTNYEYICNSYNNIDGLCTINVPIEEIINDWPCKILVTINGVSYFPYISNKIEYSISLSNIVDELNLNKNYKLYITSGETKYFHFKIIEKKKRITISMSNKNFDAYLYLNYGKKFPELNNYQWKSKGGNNEYLELNIEDSYFVGRKIKHLDGDYFLAVQGLGEGYFNLYISDNDIKLLPITEESPAGCSCEKSGDFCYFRYEINEMPEIIRTFSKELIFYFEFTYGIASIYAKLFDNGNNAQILTYLPNRYFKDYKSKNNEPFLKIKLLEGQKDYTVNSVIILSVECEKKSLFDFNVKQLISSEEIIKNYEGYLYLFIDSDNIFYLSSKSQKPIRLIFYSYINQTIIYEAKAYSGSAKVNLFVDRNNDLNRKFSNLKNIASFGVNEKDKESYFGSINKNLFTGYNEFFEYNIIFEVQAIEDCLFFLTFHYENTIINIPMSKSINEEMNGGHLLSYFQFLPEYEEVTVTINSKNQDNKISAYLKTQILDEIDTLKLTFPSYGNNDLKATSNSFTSILSIKVKNVPKEIYKKGKKVITLIHVVSDTDSKDKIEMFVYPNVNHYELINPEPKKYFYSSLPEEAEDKSIFRLNKQKDKDNIMIIEISSCQGNFDYFLSENLPNSNNEELNLIKPQEFYSNGKRIIYIANPEQQYYLSIWGLEEDEISIFKTNSKRGIEFLFQYYTSTLGEYYTSSIQTKFSHEVVNSGKVRIKLPDLQEIGPDGKSKKIKDINYSVVITDNQEDFKYMDSICYLSKVYDSFIEKKIYEQKGIVIKSNKNENFIIIEGLIEEKIYYINILMKNLITNEIFSFSPEQISPKKKTSKTLFYIILLIISITMFLVLFYFYKKYKLTKITLDYEVNDIKNFGKIPKSISELKNLEVKKEKESKEKYNSLTEDSDNI